MNKLLLLSVVAVGCFFLPGLLSAQTGVSLVSEIQNMERTAGRQDISAAERHDALVRLARLRQLSGDIEGAAKNWLDAAAAIPGQVDDDALLACAYCLAAMGEWDRARTALEPLLPKSPRARFLNISINAINTGNVSMLEAIADNPEYSQLKSEIYFLLWNISGGSSAERWRQRLVNEFPLSPEGQLASGVNSSEVIVRPSPFWLFLGGLDSLLLQEALVRTNSVSAQAAAPVQTAPPAQTAAPSQTTAPVQTAVPSQTAPAQTIAPAQTGVARLQTGLFSREVNANTQAASLRQAGFSPSIEKRIVNNSDMWAVTVPAGSDTNRTIANLRSAGFESFPIR